MSEKKIKWSTALLIFQGYTDHERCLEELRSHVADPEKIYLIDGGKNIAGEIFYPVFKVIISKYVIGNFCISLIATHDDKQSGWTKIMNNNGEALMDIPLDHLLQNTSQRVAKTQ